jgi:hypothetical protein
MVPRPQQVGAMQATYVPAQTSGTTIDINSIMNMMMMMMVMVMMMKMMSGVTAGIST